MGIRPLIVIVGSFIGGIILQMYKGQPPQWLLTAESAETTTASSTTFARYTGRIFGSSALCIILYLTRLRNPLYISLIGSSEANLLLAEQQSNPPWNAKWDTRSANDSMATRLSAMERYLGEAMSATPSDKMSDVETKVSNIRKKGYTNAIIIALNRADFWAESGEISKFEQMMKTLNKYEIEGGVVDNKELEKVRGKAYGIYCSKLLAEAQTFGNKGDVSQCQKRLGEIKSVQYKLNGTFVENDKLQNVENRAHQHAVLHMIDEARVIRKNGSRKGAKDKLEQAQQYAALHNVAFDKSLSDEIVR